MSVRVGWFLLPGVLLVFWSAFPTTGQAAPARSARTDRIIVKWRAASTAAARIQAEGTVVDQLARLTGLQLQVLREVAPHTQLIHLERVVADSELATMLAAMRADPDVEYAEVDERRHVEAVPNDSLFSGQWYLQDAQLAATHADMAWDTTTGSSGTVVAVLDTGVRFDHPDLGRASQGGKLLPGYDFVSADPGGGFAIANDGNGRDSDPSDPGDWVDQGDLQQPAFQGCDAQPTSSWHGTRVSGIIGARANNGIGIAGESWDAWILPVRVLGKCGGYDSDIVAAMRWAGGLSVAGVPANPYPAKIINLSLGSGSPCPQSYIDAITALHAQGVLVVASAGNEGTVLGAPASCPGVLAVAAIRHAGTKVGFSSLGLGVGIGAPGGNCVNTTGACLFSIDTTVDIGTTNPGGPGYTDQINFNVGTSFSAPIASGAAALMHAVNARLGPELLIARLEQSAAPFPTTSPTPQPPAIPVCHVPVNTSDVQLSECICTTSTCGAGMLDANQAVAAAQRPIAAVTLPASVTAGQDISLDGSISGASCNRTITTYAWAVQSSSGTPPTITGADQAMATVQAPMSGTFTLRLTVTDSAGAQDTADVVVNSSSATTSAIAPLAGDACPTAITVAQTPAQPSGGGGGHGGGGMWTPLWLAPFVLFLWLARQRALRAVVVRRRR